ncbi:MAG: cell envelope integrity protein CreD [Hyphomicrobium sp.]
MESLSATIRRLLGSPAFKFFLICGLILIMAIPLLLVWGLVNEREGRAAEVRQSVASEWGGAQYIDGPLLIVPYTVKRFTNEGDKRVEELVERRAVFLPQSLKISGNATTKVLHRSIYDVAVYTGLLDFEGSFAAANIADVVADAQSVRWRDAVLAVAISDVSGLKTAAALNIDGGETLAFEPSIGVPATLGNGIHVRLAPAKMLFETQPGTDAASGIKGFNFKFSLTLNGSSELTFAPVARQTSVEITSDWRDPSFMGAFLPNDRVIEAASFSARWQIPHLARSVPQSWSLADQPLERMQNYAFGVRFFVPVDFYQLVTRAAKYAMMFLATAFMAVFLLEIGSDRQVHPVQYLFVGLAMTFFYILLLSFSEQIGFLSAYLVAAVATGGLISLYVAKVQKSLGKGLAMAGVFFLLYGLLYMILQLEDYALIAGAVAGFAMLAVVMFATLNIDWSGKERPAS